MTTLIAPQRRYGHLSAEKAKETLLLFARLDRKSFNIKMSEDAAVEGADPFTYYLNLFTSHGLLEPMANGGYSLTGGGIELVSAKIQEPIHRLRASEEIESLRARAAWILDDPDQIYYVRGIFIFGSYVDTEKDILGDLDVGISFGIKPDYSKMSDAQLLLIARAIQKQLDAQVDPEEIGDARIWGTDRMLEFLHNGDEFISLHMLKELPTLHIKNAMCVYDSSEEISQGFLLRKNELPIINRYLNRTM